MKRILIGLCSIGLLSACSSPAIKDTSLIEQAAINMIESGQQDVSSILESARNLQVQAQQADLYYYSPKHMIQAEKEMAQAEEAFKLKKSDQVILTHSLTAKTLFERGLKIKPLVEQHLKPSFDALEMLKAINSHVVLKDDFADLENDIKDLIILIEEEKIAQATQEQLEMQKDITKLEIATLKASYLTPAELALEKAEDAEADDFAIKTFEIAEQKVKKLGELIDTQYQNRQLIVDASTQTVRHCQHAENIAKAVKPLLKLNPETGEQHILYVETLLTRIASALEEDNQNHLPLNKQSIALAQKVETLNKQAKTNLNNPNWAQEKNQLQDEIAQLKAQVIQQQADLAQAQEQANKLAAENEAANKPATAEAKSEMAQQDLKQAIEAQTPANTASETPSPDATQGLSEETITEPAAPVVEQSNEAATASIVEEVTAPAPSEPSEASAPTTIEEPVIEQASNSADTEVTQESAEATSTTATP